MEVKPGYKRTDLGIIPDDWETKPMSEIGKFAKGKGLLKEDIRAWGRIPGIPYTSLYTDFSEVINYDQIKWFVDDEERTYLVCEPCVLIASSSNMAANTGKACTLPGFVTVAIGREVIIFKTPENCRFLSYLLSTSTYRRQTLTLARGTTIKHLYPATFRNYQIALPSPSEQNAIAETLSDVDVLLGGLDRLLDKKRDLKQAAMQQLLTGQTRLRGFNGEWKRQTLGRLFHFSGGYSASREQLSTKGHCYLHYGDIHKSSKTFVDVGAEYQDLPKLDISLRRVCANSLLEDGDVVFVDASEDDEGTSRHVVVTNKDSIPFIAGLHTIVAKPKSKEMSHAYRRYCFQTLAVRQQFLFYAVGTKVSGISKTNIAKLTLRVPDISEQDAIAEVLLDMDAEIAALEQRREKIRALKRAMMQELLTGKTRLI